MKTNLIILTLAASAMTACQSVDSVNPANARYTAVTDIKPNWWGTTHIEQYDSEGRHRAIQIQPNWFGTTRIVSRSNY
jgi:hypothetical protein